MLTIFLPPPLLVALAILIKMRTPPRRHHYFNIMLLTTIGALLAEAVILADEVNFAKSVLNMNYDSFARPRIWPNSMCSRVYVKGNGIHAID